MILGSALLERSPEARIQAWADYAARGRDAIAIGRIHLPPAEVESDAEAHAAEAVKRLGIHATAARTRRSLDVIAALGLGAPFAIFLAPWTQPLGLAGKALSMLPGPLLAQRFRHRFRESIGDFVSRKVLSTKRRFRRLGRLFPGRIERDFGSSE
jgi:hypothetical protein